MLDTSGFLGGSHCGRLKLSGVTILPRSSSPGAVGRSWRKLDLKGFNRATHDGIVLDNCNSFGQLLGWRALLQARNAQTKGGQSATQMYAYSQYLFMIPIVATVDFDAKDAYLVDGDSMWRSKWLCGNTVLVKLEEGEAFYEQRVEVAGPAADTLFAQHLRAQRGILAGDAA